MLCKCRYFLRNDDGDLVCSVCGKPAHATEIEDKMQGRQETKAPLYVSNKDKAKQEA